MKNEIKMRFKTFENYDDEELNKLKVDIDEMPHEQLARLWRFGDSSNKLLQGDAGSYLKDRLFNHFGRFNPSLSKNIGWQKTNKLK